MFGLGPMEMVIIGVLAILLFGNRLPEVAKSVGKGFNEFKKGMHGIDEEVNSASRVSSSSSSSRVARSIEDREEVSTPKFEPPPAEGAA
ncbi:MAG: twin-arginine translocase TatA/TatE family subunit [Planctomycetia bacterium]|nr:twin-arginine translocase TatA/TatE family subunit [Planctomycetia bacterium]